MVSIWGDLIMPLMDISSCINTEIAPKGDAALKRSLKTPSPISDETSQKEKKGEPSTLIEKKLIRP